MRDEVQILKERIDEKIRCASSQKKQPKPSYYTKRYNGIKITVVVDAIPLFQEEREEICQYLNKKWLGDDTVIVGDYFTIRKKLFCKKYIVSAKCYDYDYYC